MSARLDIIAMRELASAKVAANVYNEDFIPDLEQALETIAGASTGCFVAPVNQNLLGIAYMLLAECKRLRR